MDGKPVLRQVAPGVWIDPAKTAVPMDRKLMMLDDAGFSAIGLTESQTKTLVRLFETQEITIYRITPRIMLLDVDSWNGLLARVKSDPWYWEDRKRLDRYRGTYS